MRRGVVLYLPPRRTDLGGPTLAAPNSLLSASAGLVSRLMGQFCVSRYYVVLWLLIY